MLQSGQRQFKDFLTEFNEMDANNEVVVDLMPGYASSAASRSGYRRGNAAGNSAGAASMSSAINGLLKGSRFKQKFPMDFIITGETNIAVNVKSR